MNTRLLPLVVMSSLVVGQTHAMQGGHSVGNALGQFAAIVAVSGACIGCLHYHVKGLDDAKKKYPPLDCFIEHSDGSKAKCFHYTQSCDDYEDGVCRIEPTQPMLEQGKLLLSKNNDAKMLEWCKKFVAHNLNPNHSLLSYNFSESLLMKACKANMSQVVAFLLEMHTKNKKQFNCYIDSGKNKSIAMVFIDELENNDCVQLLVNYFNVKAKL